MVSAMHKVGLVGRALRAVFALTPAAKADDRRLCGKEIRQILAGTKPDARGLDDPAGYAAIWTATSLSSVCGKTNVMRSTLEGCKTQA